jgi:hypothetical protein
LVRCLLFAKLSFCYILKELLPELFGEPRISGAILIGNYSAAVLFWSRFV